MLNMRITENYTLAGVTFSTSKTLSKAGALAQVVSVPAGEASTLTTRTDDTDGSITLDTASGTILTDGDRIDLYWEESGVLKYARGGTIGTIAGAVVPFTGMSGDVLPSTSTVVTVAKCVEIDTAVAGTNVDAIALSCANRSTFVIAGSDDAEDFARTLDAGCAYLWFDGNGEDNPITGDTIAKVFVSHNGNASADMQVGFLYNNG